MCIYCESRHHRSKDCDKKIPCCVPGCLVKDVHVHTCQFCGTKNVHHSRDCPRLCKEKWCTRKDHHIHQCSKCPDNTHSSLDLCPRDGHKGVRGAIIKMVVGAVLDSVGKAHEQVLAAAAAAGKY